MKAAELFGDSEGKSAREVLSDQERILQYGSPEQKKELLTNVSRKLKLEPDAMTYEDFRDAYNEYLDKSMRPASHEVAKDKVGFIKYAFWIPLVGTLAEARAINSADQEIEKMKL